MNIEELTHNQPFCSGVILLQEDSILVTLNKDHLPDNIAGYCLRIGGVGGGQEPDETLLQCALREAEEELSQSVDLISSPVTYFHDMDSDEIRSIACTDLIAPFLLQRMKNPTPSTPYKQGLPTGPHLYFGQYLASAKHLAPSPGDDVEALMWVPLDAWNRLNDLPTIGELGLLTIRSEPLAPDTRLYLPADESLSTVVHLLKEYKKPAHR